MEDKIRTTKLIKIARHHGHTLQKRLNNLNSKLRTCNLFFRQPYSLCCDNLANILKLEETFTLKQQLVQKLNNLDKIHNFTTSELPQELKNLLNKGTNFIPTLATSSTRSLQKTINTEVMRLVRLVVLKLKKKTLATRLAVF